MTKNVVQIAYNSIRSYFRKLHRSEVPGDAESLRKIPEWMLKQLCRSRLAEYRSEVRSGSPTPISNLDPYPGAVDRPYGIPWEVQGVVEDVWHLILEWITEPKDIINLFEVSDLFRNILRRRYIQARVPEILDICLARMKEDLLPEPEPVPVPMEFEDDDDIDFDVLFGHRVRIPTSPVMKLRMSLRLLSKLTKKSMEEFLSAKKELQPWENEHDIPTLHLTTIPGIAELVREMDEANIIDDGLFYPQKVWINNEQILDPEAEVTTVLQRIGRSVRKLRFNYNNFLLDNYFEIFYWLKAWVELTPNLEELEIYPNHERGHNLFDEISEFPTLPGLKMFGYTNDLPLDLRVGILRANPTVRIIIQEKEKLEWFNWAWRWRCDAFPAKVVLESLRLEEWYCVCAPPKTLLKAQFQWPLKKLTMIDGSDIYFTGTATYTSMEVFQFLNQFQTLEELQVKLVVEDTGGVLDLPNLRKFQWQVQRNFENLDFILPLGKLEHLHCSIGNVLKGPFTFSEEEIHDDREEVVQFFLGLRNGNFRDTNMKKIFPRLKTIKILKGLELERIYRF